MSKICCEYIWLDGGYPSPCLRSKTRVVDLDRAGDTLPPIWGFDGSSTGQAPGDNSDCMLVPVFSCPDPTRGGSNRLVLCEVFDTEGNPCMSNQRTGASCTDARFKDRVLLYGMEQEYTLMTEGRPAAFPKLGYPDPQGRYYCGVGPDRAWGRHIVDSHLRKCLDAGLAISGVNAEVMPGQWEFQIGPLGLLEIGDQMLVARYLLQRVAEDSGICVSFDPKPVEGDWNGAGCHTNVSTGEMRAPGGLRAVRQACEDLAHKAMHHIDNYGAGYRDRLTGEHETAPWDQYRWGVADRTASVRIPQHVYAAGCGYLEDRRPGANCDPYLVARTLAETICNPYTGDAGAREQPEAAGGLHL